MNVPTDFYELPRDTVHVLCLNLATQHAALAVERDVLDASEQERVAGYTNPWHGQRYGCSRSLLRHVLGVFLRQSPANIVFNYGRYGKPSVDGIDFSLSHCGDWLALAVSQGRRIGIDLENRVDPRDFQGVARQCFSPQELAKLAEGEDATLAFCATWVRKEAVLKAAGRGLDAMPGFCTTSSKVFLADDRELPAQWHVGSLVAPADHQLALAVEGGPTRNRSFRLE